MLRDGAVWCEVSWTVLSRIFSTGWSDPRFPLLLLLIVLAVWAYQFLYTGGEATKRLLERSPVRVGLAAAMLLWLALIAQVGSASFIYFDF